MNALFVAAFPTICTAGFGPLPTNESAGITGWDDYADDLAEQFRCKAQDLRCVNSEEVVGTQAQHGFDDLEHWVAQTAPHRTTEVHAFIDGQGEALTVEFYYGPGKSTELFARVVEMEGFIISYYAPVSFFS